MFVIIIKYLEYFNNFTKIYLFNNHFKKHDKAMSFILFFYFKKKVEFS
jgi:hypothetical protein